MESRSPDTPARRFETTHWSLVVAAGLSGPASRAALEQLCTKYWFPIYSYVRRKGNTPDDAQDLTQEFFARLLEQNWVADADRSRGRFRGFILMVLKRFLANEWDKARAQKRGGNIRLQSLSEMAEQEYVAFSAAGVEPDIAFEREWATTLLNNVLNTVRSQYSERGRAELFSVLKPYLTADKTGEKYADQAAAAGMTEAAFKVAVCRLRERYRKLLQEEVASTVADPRDVESEVRRLFRIVARKS